MSMNHFAVFFALACLVSCSSANREGPDVTCADLEGGKENACAEGIIAYCPDGETVKYQVCTIEGDEEGAKEICEQPWQIPGRYQCEQADQECLGCATP